MDSLMKRTWAEIDLDALENNYRTIQKAVRPGCKIMSVVKADAYGHGAAYVAPFLQELGSDWFAVSNLEEAIHLRKHGIVRPILILGYTPPDCAALLDKYQITQTVYSEKYARLLGACAVRENVMVQVHIKLDTGMSRIGFMYQNAARDAKSLDEVARACHIKGLRAEGIFTHFAVSDEKKEGREYTLRQYDCFMDGIDKLNKKGITFSLRHCCNSGAIMDYPQMNLDMVRPGIILYGLWPSGKLSGQLPLRPVMQMKSTISQVKNIEPDTTVSYGRTYAAPAEVRIATVPIGYADGYQRVFAGHASMLVCGNRAPVIGRVCMDQLMLNVTGIHDVEEGATVTVFGRDGQSEITVDELCAINQTINYEMVCLITKRVPRIYYHKGIKTGILDYVCPDGY